MIEAHLIMILFLILILQVAIGFSHHKTTAHCEKKLEVVIEEDCEVVMQIVFAIDLRPRGVSGRGSIDAEEHRRGPQHLRARG